MAEAEGIPPTASVASVGPSIRYLGEHIYGFSGAIIVAEATVTCLEFTSGSGYIVAKLIHTGNYTNFGQGFRTGMEVKLNGIDVIVHRETVRSVSSTEAIYPLIFKFLIPPFTKVKTSAYTDEPDNVTYYHVLSGRVYDV